VVAHPHVGEAEVLGETRRIGDRLRTRRPAELREVDADPHDGDTTACQDLAFRCELEGRT
jgi:hypothetical protein